jgi:hypothetical protein
MDHARLRVVSEELTPHGWKIVLLTRLIPFFPGKISNYFFGLTPSPCAVTSAARCWASSPSRSTTSISAPSPPTSPPWARATGPHPAAMDPVRRRFRGHRDRGPLPQPAGAARAGPLRPVRRHRGGTAVSWMKWLPWRFVIRYVARKQGFLDPIALLAKLHGFAQPSEVGEPIELLRAGVVFHARGLINSRVIQHNLDWVWPYWIERQFDPRDVSFIPRAFSITHINLTHRNWTAIGYPDCEELPIVDPRGLLTPMLDGWSLDGWLLAEDGRCLLPSRTADCRQWQDMDPGVRITTETGRSGLALSSRAWVQLEAGIPVCKLHCRRARHDAWLVLALRPHNPEGISFIHQVRLSDDRMAWTVDDSPRIEFSAPPSGIMSPITATGRVHPSPGPGRPDRRAAAMWAWSPRRRCFPVKAGVPAEITATIPLAAGPQASGRCLGNRTGSGALQAELPGTALPVSLRRRGHLADPAFAGRRLSRALHLQALLVPRRRLHHPCPAVRRPDGSRRTRAGALPGAADGARLFPLPGRRVGFQRRGAVDPAALLRTDRTPLAAEWQGPVRAAPAGSCASASATIWTRPMPGCCRPASAPSTWDPTIITTGTISGGSPACARRRPCCATGIPTRQPGVCAGRRRFRGGGGSQPGRLRATARPPGHAGVALPPPGCRRHRFAGVRLSGAALCGPDDPRLLDCVEFLLERCFVNGAFYQDMIHSGLNAYLTLHVAQVLLRAGDPRHLELMDAVAALASPTGQWPEAIHPAHRRRLHGRRPPCLGRRRMGADDAQLFRARGRRGPHPVRGHSRRAGSNRTSRSASDRRRPASARVPDITPAGRRSAARRMAGDWHRAARRSRSACPVSSRQRAAGSGDRSTLVRKES